MPNNFKFATARHAAGFVQAARGGHRGNVLRAAGHGGGGGGSGSGAASLARKKARSGTGRGGVPF